MIKNKKGGIGIYIFAIVVLLIIVGSFSWFAISINDVSENVFFSPASTVSGVLDNLESSSDKYNIVVSDNASSHDISKISNFSSVFGIGSEALLESEIDNSKNKIFMGRASEFSSVPYADKIGENDAIIIYNSSQDSIYAFSSDSSESLDELLKKMINNTGLLNYSSLKISSGEVSELSFDDEIKEPVVIGSRSINDSGAMVGDTVKVILNVTADYDLDNLVIGEKLPSEWEIKNVDPSPVVNSQGTITWMSSGKNSGNYLYKYEVVPFSNGSGVDEKVGNETAISSDFEDNLEGNPEIVDGKKGNSIKLDGSGDYLDLSNVSRDNKMAHLEKSSISGWFKYESDGDIYSEGSGRSVQQFFRVRIREGKLEVHMKTYDDGGLLYYDNDEALEKGKWYHFSVVRKEDKFTTYINGEEVASDTLSKSDYKFRRREHSGIGAFVYYDVSNYFKGSIDEVMLFNKSLSEEEIDKLYNLNSFNDGLIKKWDFESSSGLSEEEVEIEGKMGAIISEEEYNYEFSGDSMVSFSVNKSFKENESVDENVTEDEKNESVDENVTEDEKNETEEIDCEDSDGGINTEKAGTVTYNGKEYTDKCFNEYNESESCSGSDCKIREFACGDEGLIEKEFSCYNCSKGACLKEYECSEGETKDYTCENGETVEGWCVCSGNSWNCTDEPEEKCPISNIYELAKEIDNHQDALNYKIVIGDDAKSEDSVGAIELAGRFNIRNTVVDDEVMNRLMDNPDSDSKKENLIIVGGPAINKMAADFLNVEYPSGGDSSNIPEGKSVISSKKDNGKKILIAGWEADNTRSAVEAFKSYEDYKDKLSENIVNVVKNSSGNFEFGYYNKVR